MTTAKLGPAFGSTAQGWDLLTDDHPWQLGGSEEAWAEAPGLWPVTPLTDHTGLPLRVSVSTPSREFIAHLPRRDGVQGMVELNGVGSGQVSVSADDAALSANPTAWADGNLVAVHYGEKLIHSWLMESVGEDTDDARAVTLSRSGRGDLAILDHAVLYPEAALTRDTSEDRYFNFGSVDGPWYVAKQWQQPTGVPFDQSHRYPLPRKWPITDVKWLWSDRPRRTGNRYFRGKFTLTEATRVRFWAVGDDSMMLMLNGAPILRQRRDRWKRARATTMRLPAGTHQLAARVHYDNALAADGAKGGGFLLVAASVNKKDEVQEILMRSTPSRWKVRRQLKNPPGWFPANVLQVFVDEAKVRGVAGFDGLTLDFGAVRDSTRRRWRNRNRIAQSYKVGTGGLDLLRQLIERGMDVSSTGDGTLQAFKEKGRDRRHAVALDGYVSAKSDTSTGAVLNTALTQYRRGWAEFVNPASVNTYGRREAALSSGGSDNRADARSQVAATFSEYARPVQTVEVVTNSLRGPQPFYDYEVGDVVTAPLPTGRGPCRVLAIGYAEPDDGVVEWSHQLAPVVAA